MAIKLKRWRLRKLDLRTGREVDITAPEPRRHYWTKSGALVERLRINSSMRATGLPWRYEVEKR